MNYRDKKSLVYSDPAAYDGREDQDPLERYAFAACAPVVKRLIEKYIQEGQTIADLGAGTLEHTQHLGKAALIYAVEINPIMLDFGRKKIAPIANKVVMLAEDAIHTSITSGACDIVWSMGLVEYLDINAFFKEVGRITKPNGLLLVQFTNKFHPFNLLLHLANTALGRASKAYYSIFQVEGIARKHGFILKEKESRAIFLVLPRFFQRYCIRLWKLLDFLYAPFQRLFPLGSNVYCVMRKQCRDPVP